MSVRIVFISLVLFTYSVAAQEQPTTNDKIDYKGFILLGSELDSVRRSRLVNQEDFIEMSKDSNTIILDTRSAEAFERMHVEGAIHLNFSDFTEEKLAILIPRRETRILIYCNNNFRSTDPSMVDKSPRLALNIPTFINLWGYGYENIYELSDRVYEEESKIKLTVKEK